MVYFRAILKSIPTVTLQITLRIKNSIGVYIFAAKIPFIPILNAALIFEQIFRAKKNNRKSIVFNGSQYNLFSFFI